MSGETTKPEKPIYSPKTRRLLKDNKRIKKDLYYLREDMEKIRSKVRSYERAMISFGANMIRLQVQTSSDSDETSSDSEDEYNPPPRARAPEKPRILPTPQHPMEKDDISKARKFCCTDAKRYAAMVRSYLSHGNTTFIEELFKDSLVMMPAFLTFTTDFAPTLANYNTDSKVYMSKWSDMSARAEMLSDMLDYCDKYNLFYPYFVLVLATGLPALRKILSSRKTRNSYFAECWTDGWSSRVIKMDGIKCFTTAGESPFLDEI